MEITKTTSRKFEQYLGYAGFILGICSSCLHFVFNGIDLSSLTILGGLAILGSLLGLVASYYVINNTEIAGIMFILATILLVLHSGTIGIIGAVLFLIAGISALFRN